MDLVQTRGNQLISNGDSPIVIDIVQLEFPPSCSIKHGLNSLII